MRQPDSSLQTRCIQFAGRVCAPYELRAGDPAVRPRSLERRSTSTVASPVAYAWASSAKAATECSKAATASAGKPSLRRNDPPRLEARDEASVRGRRGPWALRVCCGALRIAAKRADCGTSQRRGIRHEPAERRRPRARYAPASASVGRGWTPRPSPRSAREQVENRCGLPQCMAGSSWRPLAATPLCGRPLRPRRVVVPDPYRCDPRPPYGLDPDGVPVSTRDVADRREAPQLVQNETTNRCVVRRGR
jgi:hypothetical protein